jgi:hypothetical protein
MASAGTWFHSMRFGPGHVVTNVSTSAACRVSDGRALAGGQRSRSKVKLTGSPENLSVLDVHQDLSAFHRNFLSELDRAPKFRIGYCTTRARSCAYSSVEITFEFLSRSSFSSSSAMLNGHNRPPVRPFMPDGSVAMFAAYGMSLKSRDHAGCPKLWPPSDGRHCDARSLPPSAQGSSSRLLRDRIVRSRAREANN